MFVLQTVGISIGLGPVLTFYSFYLSGRLFAGLPSDHAPHSLRLNYATHAIKAGADRAMLKELTNHVSGMLHSAG